MTNTVFVNSTNITTNIETAALSRVIGQRGDWSQLEAKVKVKKCVCAHGVGQRGVSVERKSESESESESWGGEVGRVQR